MTILILSLILVVISLFSILDDHSESWHLFKTETGEVRKGAEWKLFRMWSILALTAGLAVLAFFDSETNEKKLSQAISLAGTLSNKVEQLQARTGSSSSLNSATLHAEVMLERNDLLEENIPRHLFGGSAYFDGPHPQVVLRFNTEKVRVQPRTPSRVAYIADFDLPSQLDKMRSGMALKTLTRVESIKLSFERLRDDRRVLGGKLVLVLNSTTRVEFDIPAGIASGGMVHIPDVQSRFVEVFR